MSRARSRPRWDLWLAGGHVALVTLSALYLAYRLVLAPTNSEFAGMPLLVLSLPWSDWLAPAAGESGRPRPATCRRRLGFDAGLA